MSSKTLDAAIDALVDALAELPEHELEGWQRGNRLGLRIVCELGRRYPGLVQATGPVRRKSASLGVPSYCFRPCYFWDSEPRRATIASRPVDAVGIRLATRVWPSVARPDSFFCARPPALCETNRAARC